MNEAGPSWGLVLVRIVSGAVILLLGWMRLRSGAGDELVESTRAAWAVSPDLVRAWGEDVVLKHPTFFSNAVVYGEIAVGLSLFLGMLVRPLGLVGAFLFANALIVAPDEHRPLCLVLFAACLGSSISRAGAKCGGDVFLYEKLPGWITWSRAA